MKKELLSPVGNMESLYQAIHNGADAVYLGGKQYGARMFSDNFTKEELINAINYCHLYGVKIYITINTIVFNDEISDFLQYVEFIYKNGVDAVIMQDIGMINLVRKKFPDLEIHASTQVHNYNNEGLSLLKEMGVSRVVITNIESGTRKVSAEELSKFSKIYGWTMEELLEGKKEEKEIPMFARALVELSKEDQEEIMNLIKFKKMYKDKKFIE